MDKVKRRKEILSFYKNDKYYSVEELSLMFKVSIPTIYRDLSYLEKENFIIKKDGEIIFIKDELRLDSFNQRLLKYKEQKRAIAAEAVKLINNEETLALDDSTTTYFLGEELVKKNLKINILSNSAVLPNLFINQNKIKFISTGGILNPDFCFLGNISENALSSFYFDKFFFSTAGISLESGIFETYIPEACKLKKILMSRSRESILLIDSSKFNKGGFFKIADLNEIDLLISDEGLEKENVQKLKEKGIKAILSKLKQDL